MADAARGAAAKRGGWRRKPEPEPISITRCRELLGEDAELMSDQDVEDIREHAETMARIVVEMYQEQRRVSA